MSGYVRKAGGHGGTRPALKGNLALKSSPLNPSSGKSVTQDLVVDHMNAHYRKLLSAKSAIDASVPKAYTSSQKVRDRQTRDMILSDGKRSASAGRPSSARSSRSNSARHIRPGSTRNAAGRQTFNNNNMEPFKLDDVDYGNFTQDEINCINAMVNDTIDSERLDRVLNGQETHQLPGGKATSRSGGSGSGGQKTSRGMMEALNMNTLQRKTMSADILDKRTHVFSEPSETFTPRVLRNHKYKNVPSKLSQTKHFRPAVRGHNSPQKGYAQSATESEMLDETLMSRDFSTRMTMSGAVPKLDISIDQDHMKWLQEQSARKESKSYRPLEEELALTEKRPAKHSGYTRTKIKKEEEELSYLDFITDVTNDVLTRGIFTNRVLCNVFDEHVEKNKHRLDEDRMRGMLDNLRDDLGIPSHESYREDPNDVGMGSSRPPVRSKTKTTGYSGDTSQFRNVRVGSREGGSSQAYGDTTDSFNRRNEVNVKPLANQQHELQSLMDIAEVSEKTASVSSFDNSGRKAATPRKNKEMDDALINLLGLEDAGKSPLVDIHEEDRKGPAAMETLSVKSGLSSHTSDRLSRKSADPLSAYADSLQHRESTDKISLKSAGSKASRTPTLRDAADDKNADRSLSRKSSLESASRSVEASQRSEPSALSRKSSTDSTLKASQKSSAGVAADVKSPVSRRSSDESISKQSGKLNATFNQTTSSFQHGSDEGEELESNVDFGKTTLFGKTRNLGLTYKALSQASDEDDAYSDNFSDAPANDDDDF